MIVKLFIVSMIKLELFVVMVGGFVIVVGLVMVGYVIIGVEFKYLIVVSFMVVFGGFLMVKMIVLEIEILKEDLVDLEI